MRAIPDGQIFRCQYVSMIIQYIKRKETDFSTKRKGLFGFGVTQAV